MRKTKQVLRWLAVVLMIVLALARGAGGVVLVVSGDTTFPEAGLEPSTMVLLGALLILIALLVLVAGIGVAAGKGWAWTLGIGAAIAFVIDGALNGYLLFGKPGDGGTVVNLLVASAIITCLVLSRRGSPNRGDVASG